jgi:hypothetical protein
LRSVHAVLAAMLASSLAIARADDPEPRLRLSEPRLVPVRPEGAGGSPLGGALQVGWAAPWGAVTAADGDRFTRLLSYAVPIQAEGTWALDARDRLGAFVAWAPSGAGSGAPSCSAGWSCSGSDFRVGALAHHGFAPEAPLAPSVALAFGWERSALHASGPPGHDDRIAHGLFGAVRFAAERRIRAGVRAGPYVAVLAGTFGQERRRAPEAPAGWSAIRDRALHGWLEIGARVSIGR